MITLKYALHTGEVLQNQGGQLAYVAVAMEGPRWVGDFVFIKLHYLFIYLFSNFI